LKKLQLPQIAEVVLLVPFLTLQHLIVKHAIQGVTKMKPGKQHVRHDLLVMLMESLDHQVHLTVQNDQLELIQAQVMIDVLIVLKVISKVGQGKHPV